jgi:hypothetical protein
LAPVALQSWWALFAESIDVVARPDEADAVP